MKILYLMNYPAPNRVKFFNELGKFCDLTVLYELRGASNRNKKWKIDIEKKTYKEFFLDAKKTTADGGLSFKVFRYIKKKYDIIVVTTHITPTAKIAMLYMRIFNIPFILNIDGEIVASINMYGRFKYILKKFMFKLPNYYIVTNEETKKYLKCFNVVNNIFKYRFSSIFDNDICRLGKDEKLKEKQKMGIKEEWIIISVGRFLVNGDPFWKGFNILMESSKKIEKKCGIYIIGGEIIKEYRDIIKKNKLKNIHFISFKNNDELESYYKIADIFVLATKLDTWGLVVNEAIAKGLPVITTKTCGAGLELIKEGINGYLLDERNTNDLSTIINNLLNNKTLLNNISNRNVLLSKKYTIETMVKDHLKIFKKIVGDEKFVKN